MSNGVAALSSSEPEPAPATAVVDMADVRFRWSGRDSFSLAIGAFQVAASEKLLLIGPSGSGKSTLLSLLCGIVTPDAGRIHVLDQDLSALDAAARDRFRVEHVGIIFQMFNLLPYLSVIDNVLLPLSFSKPRRSRATEGGLSASQEAARLLQRLGLDPGELAARSAARLSVGQQQRVAAARALIGKPEILVADEPTSALDRKHQQHFLDLLFSEADAVGTTVILVSHDETLAPKFDRVLNLADTLANTMPATAP